MSDLDLRQFHSFLEERIEQSSRGGVFSIDKTIQTLVTKHTSRFTMGVRSGLEAAMSVEDLDELVYGSATR